MADELNITTANPEFLSEILIGGGLIGKLTSQEAVDHIYLQLTSDKYGDRIFSALVDFIDMESEKQDQLYSAADDIIQATPLIDEEDENLRSDMCTLLSDNLTGLIAALEVIIYGNPSET